MNYKKYAPLCLLLAATACKLEAKEEKVGIVNFASCISESKYGKQEQEAFEAVKNQMTSLMEDTDKQLNEIANKFNDPDFMDGISPEGEQELKAKFQSLQEELARYQQQYYQLLNQANYKLVQTMSMHINEAAKTVAQKKKLSYVVNKDAVFFYEPGLDVTNEVVQEMNTAFAKTQNAKDAQGNTITNTKSE